MERKKTFSWQYPVATIPLVQQMSGLDYLQAVGAGEIPYPPLKIMKSQRKQLHPEKQ